VLKFADMPSPATDKVLGVADGLSDLLARLPADPRRDKALYHLGRLQKAFVASHQEAVRFAAFTVNKTVHDTPEWGPEVAAAMDTLRAALAEAGHDFLKGH
jgi:deferrochelatase/peroxidase EfeB